MPRVDRDVVVARVDRIPNCYFCLNEESKIVPAEFDGKTKLRHWAFMCKEHFDKLGVGLGTGKGQRLVLMGDSID
jgi:hypothetical protein